MKVNIDSVVWLPLPFRMELECGKVERLNESPREIRSAKTSKKLKSHLVPPPGFEPRPHWLEASALTFAPTTLLPLVSSKERRQVFTWCMGIVQTRFMCNIPVSMICVPIHHVPNIWNFSSYVSFFSRVKPGNGCNRHVPCSFSELKFVGPRHWKLGENVLSWDTWSIGN